MDDIPLCGIKTADADADADLIRLSFCLLLCFIPFNFEFRWREAPVEHFSQDLRPASNLNSAGFIIFHTNPIPQTQTPRPHWPHLYTNNSNKYTNTQYLVLTWMKKKHFTSHISYTINKNSHAEIKIFILWSIRYLYSKYFIIF